LNDYSFTSAPQLKRDPLGSTHFMPVPDQIPLPLQSLSIWSLTSAWSWRAVIALKEAECLRPGANYRSTTERWRASRPHL